MKTDKHFEASPKQNCKRALQVYGDLNISLESVRDHLSNPNVVAEDIRSNNFQIAKGFLLIVSHFLTFTSLIKKKIISLNYGENVIDVKQLLIFIVIQQINRYL